MAEKVGVRELRQNLSRYLDRVRAGEDLVVTDRGQVVARLIPAGPTADAYADLAADFGATVPVEPLEAIVARLAPRSAPSGTTDALLADMRSERVG
jgi:prevent-host-death family protein